MAIAGYTVYPILVLLIFVIFPQALLADASSYEGKTIAHILFVPREQPVDPEELHKILPVKERTPLHLDDVRAAISRLYATGTYADIKVDAEIRDGELILRFITQNNWFIGRVAMKGQIKSPPNAGQVANATRLELGAVQSDDKMNQALDGIQQLFKSNGYFQSQVQPRFTYNQRTNQVRIDFEVQSGRRAKYRTPTLIGDLKMPPEKVISATRWQGWFGWRPVTQSTTQRGLSSVRKKYQSQDRLMALITLDKIDFDEDTGTARPALNIRAGPKVSITAVGVKISRGKLQRNVPVFEEHTVDDDLLVEGQRNLRDYFQSEGYFEAEVEFKAQRVVNDKAQIDYIVNPGKRHNLVQVDIEGNHYFDTRTIRERMFLLPASLQFSRGRYRENYLLRDEASITNLY